MLISKRLLVPAALAAAILFALLWLNAPAIRSAGNEIGDLAANSLLVIDAKNFRLLTGNYSRLGFNHPGPAFLYVLAGGEALFHDVLSLTAGPIGGQLIAVCFLTAVWVGLLTYQLCRLMEGTLEGLTASAAFLAVLVSLEPQSLAGMWFPHLYVLAFGVFLFSLARLATGSLDGLWITTLAGSMLIHGHASFLAIVPLMAGSALALGVASRRRCGPERSSELGWSWEEARLPVATSSLILVAFAVPIIIDAILNFPGEFPKYVRYGAQAPGNGWRAAGRFISGFWGGLPGLAMGTAFVALLLSGRSTARQRLPTSGATATAWVVVAATACVALYARRAIDDLAHTYTALFYYACVAAVFAVAAVSLLGRAPFRRIVLPAALSCALVATALGARPSVLFTSDDVPGIVEGIRLHAGRGARLDLDNSAKWATVWSMAAGVTLAMKRDGFAGFCIGEGWHVLFTREFACLAQSPGTKAFRLGTVRDAEGSVLPDVSMRFGDLQLDSAPPR